MDELKLELYGQIITILGSIITVGGSAFLWLFHSALKSVISNQEKTITSINSLQRNNDVLDERIDNIDEKVAANAGDIKEVHEKLHRHLVEGH